MSESATWAVELNESANATDLYGEPKYMARNEIQITTVAYMVKPADATVTQNIDLIDDDGRFELW